MKEFYKTQKITYNLMSFTAFKALIIFSALLEGPKTFKELGEIIENHPYLHEKVSTDTMRVYFNSLRRIGCVIKRIKGDDKISRYMLLSHPFELQVSPEQKSSLLKIYKSLVKSMDIYDFLYFDNFFNKIGTYIKNNDFIFDFQKYSPIKNINKKLLEDLLDCCEKKYQIVVRYASPQSGEKDIEILTDKIDIQNGKAYLCGVGLEYKEYSIFLLNRIKEIREIKINTQTEELEPLKILYEVDTDTPDIGVNEKLVSKQGNKCLIEAITTNKFLLRQKLLSLGAGCRIVEPIEFRDEFIRLLNDMKAGYCNV